MKPYQTAKPVLDALGVSLMRKIADRKYFIQTEGNLDLDLVPKATAWNEIERSSRSRYSVAYYKTGDAEYPNAWIRTGDGYVCVSVGA